MVLFSNGHGDKKLKGPALLIYRLNSTSALDLKALDPVSPALLSLWLVL